MGGVCVCDHPLGGWGVGVVVRGFLGRIVQPNQQLESGMRVAPKGIKWSQGVSSLKSVLKRNSYILK